MTVLNGLAVIYKRERSDVWQVRLKLADKRWHRYSTGERQQVEATKAAVKLFYDKEFRRENKLPQTSRKFAAVATAVIAQMDEAIAAGTAKRVYVDYAIAIRNYLIPFFSQYSLDGFTPSVMQKFAAWREQQMCKKPAASTISTHNAALNKIFDYAEQHGWITQAVRPVLTNKGKKSVARPAFTLTEYRTLVRKLPHWAKRDDNSKAKSKQMRMLL